MGGKKKYKTKGQRQPALQSEVSDNMSAILSDPRFAHVAKDPKLRHVPKQERKIKLDNRFSGVFTDNHFYEVSTMDPRGRKGNFSTKEDLRKFYDMSSEEDTSDDDEDDDEEEVENEAVEESDDDDEEVENEAVEESDEESQKATNEVINNNDKDEKLQNIKYLDAGENEKEVIPSEVDEVLKDMQYDYARGAVFFSDDSSDDDSTTTDESEEDNDQMERKDEFEWGELDQDALWDTEEREVEETNRFAVCNMDWDRIKAADLLILFSSFCSRNGEVKSVTIYPSEYGKERLVEEERYGPRELRNKNERKKNKTDAERELKDLEKLEKGKLDEDEGFSTKQHFEALRRYQRNRLRYYYAVAVCDTVATAATIYKECDRQPFEGAGVLMDLRYIPDDMTFDDVPHDVCTEAPKSYEVRTFTTTALHDTRPTLTWDETNPDRKKTIGSAMNLAAKGEQVDQDQIKAFLASGSEDDSEEEAVIGSDIENSEDEDKNDTRIAKFRALINEIDEKERKKNLEKNEFNMEENFECEEKDEKGLAKNNNESADKSALTPFENYLEKKREKKKNKKKMLKTKQLHSGSESESDEEANIEEMDENSESENIEKEIVMSDDELPEDMKDIYNDPFFSDEVAKNNKFNIEKKKKKKKKKDSEQIKDTDENLELLIMNEEEDDKKHFNMRDIMKESNTKTKKNRWKDKKNKVKKIIEMKKDIKEDHFKVDLSDTRFGAIMTSGDYNIDPSHPHFKRTKAMDNLINEVQQKRTADSMEDIPEPKRQHTGSKRNEKEELSNLVKKVKNKTKFKEK